MHSPICLSLSTGTEPSTVSNGLAHFTAKELRHGGTQGLSQGHAGSMWQRKESDQDPQALGTHPSYWTPSLSMVKSPRVPPRCRAGKISPGQ